MRLYLAVINDLSPEEVQIVRAHLRICEACAREERALGLVTQAVGSLAGSYPSARVDLAVMQAISDRRNRSFAADRFATHGVRNTIKPLSRTPTMHRGYSSWSAWWMIAAVLLVAIGAAWYFLPGLIFPPSHTAFALPANLSWQSYVLYHKQTMTTGYGEHYQVETYHDMTDDAMHVQTMMDGKLDVVIVQHNNKTLGLDMMHHVAQWDTTNWLGNESVGDASTFDLAQLRRDLQTGRAVYLGKGQLDGQAVYRIRCANGQILLLNMQYMPVNVTQPDRQLMYSSLEWLHPAQVPASLWSMNVPQGFAMGTLPAKP
jgi:hypothetical protein